MTTFDRDGFRAFVLRELPDDTIIGKGAWWADHLTRWAAAFVIPAPAPVAEPQPCGCAEICKKASLCWACGKEFAEPQPAGVEGTGLTQAEFDAYARQRRDYADQSAQAEPQPVANHLRRRANYLLKQLAENRPRRALDIDEVRRVLEAIAAPSNIGELTESLIRAAWEWGVSCEIDDVRWGEAGDSHNQMLRARTGEAATRLQAALYATPQPAQPERDSHRGGNSYEASMLRNLLALIHRDGGHHLEQHGLDKTLEDAEQVLYRWREAFDAMPTQPEPVLLTIEEVLEGFTSSDLQPQILTAFDLFQEGARWAEAESLRLNGRKL